MKQQTVAVFAHPISYIPMDIDGVLDFYQSNIRGQVDLKDSKNGRYLHGDDPIAGITNYYNTESVFNYYEELKPLKERLEEGANHIWQKVWNYDTQVKITQAWINEAKKDGVQQFHHHANCMMCGTVYLNVTEGDALVFERPGISNPTTASLEDEPNPERPNEYGYDFHKDMAIIPVHNGDCLFWPPYLRHGYYNTPTDGRVSLSFNLMPTEFGSFYNPLGY